MKRYYALFCIVLLSLYCLSACDVIQEKEKERAEITAAVQKYITERSGLDLSKVEWKIKEVNTDRDTASVQVTMTSKPGGNAMVMEYHLKRENGAWTVRRAGPRGGVGTPVNP